MEKEQPRELQTVFLKLNDILNGEDITMFNIAMIALELMKFVEMYEEKSGEEKKKLVIEAMSMYETESLMSFFIKTGLPGFIDINKSIDKKKITINVDLKNHKCCPFGL